MARTQFVFTFRDVCPVTSLVLQLGLLNFPTSMQLLFRQGESPIFTVMRCKTSAERTPNISVSIAKKA